LRVALSIEGLRRCVNLRKINIQGSVVSSLAPLAGCAQLRELCITGSRISDLSPIQGCLQLTKLWIDFVEDLTHLLAKLLNLNVSFFEIDDGMDDYVELLSLEGIQACSRLERLNMSFQEAVSSLGPLAACTNLKDLDISYCSVADLAPLSTCVKLEHLDMDGCSNVTSVAPLQACAKLQALFGAPRDLPGLAALRAARPRLHETRE
jgi:Leucine-rich repeat (LRR) protein